MGKEILKAAVISTASNMIDQFCQSDISILQSKYQVDVISNFSQGSSTSLERTNEFLHELSQNNITVHNIEFSRSPFSINNVRSFYKIIQLFKDMKYDIIHCHTPIAAAITRLAAALVYRNESKVIYTAHGFHFYKGAPFVNWLIYYPVEKILSKYTDILITINTEDFEFAQRKLDPKKLKYIPGVGINTNLISSKVDKESIYQEFNISSRDFILLSVGELNDNKNHELIIRALSIIDCNNIKYVICGQGYLKEKLESLVRELNLKNRVIFTGYRKDIHNFYSVAQVFVFPSKREGLSVSLMEAMSYGLPIVCTDIRGNRDIVVNDINGLMIDPYNISKAAESILTLYNCPDLMRLFKNTNIIKSHDFSRTEIDKIMSDVYFNEDN